MKNGFGVGFGFYSYLRLGHCRGSLLGLNNRKGGFELIWQTFK
jgi:hypothetical protein